jgi:hypothetical protein
MRGRVAFLIAALALVGCASPGLRVQGYAGKQLPPEDVATVFSTMGGRYGNTEICSIDEQPVRPMGGCSNLIYVLPGAHVLGWRYGSYGAVGNGKLMLRAEAGRIYQLNASPLGEVDGKLRGMAQIIPMASGSKLTYRNVNPGYVPLGANPDDPIPYGAK